MDFRYRHEQRIKMKVSSYVNDPAVRGRLDSGLDEFIDIRPSGFDESAF